MRRNFLGKKRNLTRSHVTLADNECGQACSRVGDITAGVGVLAGANECSGVVVKRL